MNRAELLERKNTIKRQQDLTSFELESLENIQSLYSLFNMFDVDNVVDIAEYPDRNSEGNITSMEYMITLKNGGADFTKIASSPYRVVYVRINRNETVSIFVKHRRQL